MTTTNHHRSPADSPRRATPVRWTAHGAERRLRVVLGVNATTSIVAGLVLAVAPDRIDDLLGTGRPGWVRVVGLAVVLFGLDYAWVSRSPRAWLTRLTPAVIAGDVAWVVLSVVTLLLGWFSGGGVAAVILVAVAVDTFATLQYLAWRDLRSAR